ncbi:24_t:CDS:1, partial [Paraglomus occultum]
MFYSPRRQHLLHAMTRGAAIICKRNNAGVDLIIPVLLASSSSVVFTSSFADDPTSQNMHQYPEDFAFQPVHIDEPCDDLTSETTADSSIKTTRLSST